MAWDENHGVGIHIEEIIIKGVTEHNGLEYLASIQHTR